jgi:prolipoprotein diacylglyceryltransferase
VVGLYLALAGAIRFGIEYVRINRPIVGSFTLAQLIALTLIAVGAYVGGFSRPRAA